MCRNAARQVPVEFRPAAKSQAVSPLTAMPLDATTISAARAQQRESAASPLKVFF